MCQYINIKIFGGALGRVVMLFNFISERPKGPFLLAAATVIRPQELCLVAAITVTFGHKRIAAERVYCGHKSAFRPKFVLENWFMFIEMLTERVDCGRKSIFWPKETLRPHYRKGEVVAPATERPFRP